MIEITGKPISPEQVVRRAKTNSSGCAATDVGLISDISHEKQVVTVEYQDNDGKAVEGLQKIVDEAKQNGRLKISLLLIASVNSRSATLTWWWLLPRVIGEKVLPLVNTSLIVSKNPCRPAKSRRCRWQHIRE